MVQWVYQAARASGAARIAIATDHEGIRQVAQGFGAEVCMTSAAHPSGTDRLAEAADQLGLGDDELVVNLQGDEPLMPPWLIAALAEDLAAHPRAAMGTVAGPIESLADLQNPNIVKVVADTDGYALYFSRALIPWPRDRMPTAGELAATIWRRHIGLYAYRVGFLRRFVAWGPCELERTEMLEQLRALWQGARIRVLDVAGTVPGGVDSAEDLHRVSTVLAKQAAGGGEL